jgi:DNA polymerase III subunit epsilon
MSAMIADNDDDAHEREQPVTTESSGALLRRAYHAVVAQGKPLPPERLVPIVFGAGVPLGGAGNATWHGLLDQVLGNSDLFQRAEDGAWGLAEWSAEDLPLESVEFVVLDVETTGLSPTRHKLIEVAAVIIQGAETRGVFQQLINPGKRIPDFICRFTGISQEMVKGAPSAENVLPDLLTFVGRRPIVGHNVGFDLGFLGYEAERGRWFFPTDGIDTILMARRFIPGIRRVKLDVLATKLGVPVRERHRALGDTQTTADVFRLLLAKAQSEGCRTLADLRAALDDLAADRAPSRGAIANPRPTGSMYLNPAWRRDFPERPGVYLMRDEYGTVIYVGKAKNLKDRLSSYYNHPLGYTRKMDGLLQSVRDIETRVLGSELEALLVESRLIKQLQPRYNVQLRNYELYPFIKIDITADFPRVFATREVRADGGRYFGPFSSRRAVDATIEVIQKLFPIRTCTRAMPPAAKPSDPCLRYHMGRCPAPCKGTAAKEKYRATVNEIVDFLANNREDMLDKLRQRMWDAAERDDFERAALLRDIIRHADQILLGQRLMTSAIEANNLLIVYPSAEPEHAELFLVRHGRLVEQRRLPAVEHDIGAAIDDLIRRAIWLGPVPTRVGKAEVDQINIISRWVHRHSQDFGRAFFTLPAQLDDAETATNFRAAVVAGTLAMIREPAPEKEMDAEGEGSGDGAS